MINKINCVQSFGRKFGGSTSAGEYTGRDRHYQKLDDISRQINDIPRGGDYVTSEELNSALKAQNAAIGRSLIAVLNTLNGKKSANAYQTIQKNLLND